MTKATHDSLLLFLSLLPIILRFVVKGDSDNVDVTSEPVQKSSTQSHTSTSYLSRRTEQMNPTSGPASTESSFNRSDEHNKNTTLNESSCAFNKAIYNNGTHLSNNCIEARKSSAPAWIRFMEMVVWFMQWTDRKKQDPVITDRFEWIDTFFRIMTYVHATLLGVTIPLLYFTATAVLLSHRKSKKSMRSREDSEIFNSDTNDTQGFYRAYARPIPGRDGRYSFAVSGDIDMSNMFPMMNVPSRRSGENINVFRANDEERITRL